MKKIGIDEAFEQLEERLEVLEDIVQDLIQEHNKVLNKINDINAERRMGLILHDDL
jgi:chromosome segregation ATPase